MSSTADLAADSAKRALKKALEKIFDHYKAPVPLKTLALFMVDNADAYIKYCAKYKKNPNDWRALNEFLLSKGVATVKLVSTQDMQCGMAWFDFLNNARKNLPKARGGPIPATIVASLTLLDLINMGNQCDFVQEAFYHAFLGSARIQINPIPRQQVRTEAVQEGEKPIIPISTEPTKSGQQCVEERNEATIDLRLP